MVHIYHRNLCLCIIETPTQHMNKNTVSVSIVYAYPAICYSKHRTRTPQFCMYSDRVNQIPKLKEHRLLHGCSSPPAEKKEREKK